MQTLNCIHRDLLGQCSCKDCGYRGPCDGIAHPEFTQDEDKVYAAAPNDIGDGDCCVFFSCQH